MGFFFFAFYMVFLQHFLNSYYWVAFCIFFYVLCPFGLQHTFSRDYFFQFFFFTYFRSVLFLHTKDHFFSSIYIFAFVLFSFFGLQYTCKPVLLFCNYNCFFTFGELSRLKKIIRGNEEFFFIHIIVPCVKF